MSFLQNLFKGKSKVDVGRGAVKSPSTLSGAKVSGASFLEAVEKGDLETVKATLRSFPGLVSVKETGGWGRTALHKAVGEGNIEMVKLLLANNADVNVQDTLHQFTPLHSAVSRSVAELLIANGANVHARTDKVSGSATPLHNAAQEGQLEVAETLIAHGADVNAKNEWGSTPLHCAVMEKKKDVVRLLLASKADTNSRDEWGRTVFDIAQKNDDSELIEMLRRVPIKG